MKFSIFKRNKSAKTKPLFLGDTFTSYNRIIESNDVAFSAIDRISTAIAGLSFGVYSKKTNTKVDHILYETLLEPNAEETHGLFFTSIVNDIYTAGNAYLYIYRNEDGECTNLFRLNPKQVTVQRNEYNRKIYLYNGSEYTSDKVLQIVGRWGYDGLKGHSIFEVRKDTFTTSENLEAYTQNSFGNGLGKRLVIDVSKAYQNATENEQEQLKERFLQRYSGIQNSGKPLIKANGIDYSVLDSGTSTNQASELAENKNYQMKVLSQIFGVPLEMLNGEGSTDIEKLTTLFMMQAVAPIVQTLEESLQKLFRPEHKGKYYIRFNYNSLLRTSLTAKIDAYVKQITNGLLSVNEARAREELSPIKDGDFHYRAGNLLPIIESLETSIGASAMAKKEELNLQQTAHEEKNNEAELLGSQFLQ